MIKDKKKIEKIDKYNNIVYQENKQIYICLVHKSL